MTIEKAIELLKDLYNDALNSSWIRNPVAWALYQTWMKAENSGEKLR